jgi:CBS domain-containing protein
MSKVTPAVRKFMSTSPITVAPTTGRGEALALMRSKKIHHIPVCDAGRVVGIVSDADLQELEGSAPNQKQTLRDCMRSRPFIVSPEQPIDEVVKAMTAQKQSLAAVVVDQGRVVGMFTATDGLRAFADYLQRNTR